MVLASSEHGRLLRLGGLLAWLMVGLPVLLHGADEPATLYAWTPCFLGFGAAFWAATAGGRSRRETLLLLALQGLAVAGMAILLCDGYEGTLLVLVAMQLAGLVDRRTGLAWIAAQSLLLAAAIAVHWSLRPALMLSPPYLGFQVLAFLVFQAMERVSRGRSDLARVNAELLATRELLAESSRTAERLRISRELHDAVGHHLVALSLNLEVASHHAAHAGGPALEPIEVARSLTRLLLTDVGDIVDTLRTGGGVDLRRALEALVAEIPRPRVHLSLPPELVLDDPGRAQVLLRCSQEIVTNAAKHAQAENLWLEVTASGDAIEIHARDDGRGARGAPWGRGLSGMRERLEESGGRLEVETRPGEGFSLLALLPLRSAS